MSIVVMSGASIISKYNNNRIRERRSYKTLLFRKEIGEKRGKERNGSGEDGKEERKKKAKKQKGKN